jgi:hypothetical protein
LVEHLAFFDGKKAQTLNKMVFIIFLSENSNLEVLKTEECGKNFGTWKHFDLFYLQMP